MTQPKTKKLYLEALRILCIFLVMFNHTAPNGYLAFIGESNRLLYCLYLFLSVLCKVAVPIFFMISGALLIGRQESLRDLYQKRVLRMAVVLLLISIPNYIWHSMGSALSAFGFLRMIYTSTARTALWYLYAYLAFLIMLPFLRAMAARLQAREYQYLLAVHIAFTVTLTVLDNFVFPEGHNAHISAAIALEPYLFYPLMGYYVEHVLDQSAFTPKNCRLAAAAAAAAIVITCVVSVLYYRVCPPPDHAAYEACFGLLICVPALAIYFFSRALFTFVPIGGSAVWSPVWEARCSACT
ncbi:MAG: acyltransferase [Clostridia bacterium]|nr:acyltransferase [Clostridia bacterium]